MHKLTLIIFLSLFYTPHLTSAGLLPTKPLIWDLDTTDANLFNGMSRREIIRRADSYLQTAAPTITEKKISFSGNIHNYESLSIYFWPNPDNPSAPYICKDGERNPEYLEYDGNKINILSTRAKILSCAFFLTGHRQYAEQWKRDIQSWFVTKATRMNPNMEYAQVIRNHNNNHGQYYGIIDAYVLIDVVESVYLMQYCNAVDKKTVKKTRQWFKQFYSWLETSEMGRKISTAPNNLSLAYAVMLADFRTFAAGTVNASTLHTSLFSRLMEQQLKIDGSQPEELKRAKPMSYCIYNLEHVIDYCLLTQSLGTPFYPFHRAHIDAAFRFIRQRLDNPSLMPLAERNDIPNLSSKLYRLEKTIKNRLAQQ